MSDTPRCMEIVKKWCGGKITLIKMRELFDELERENAELKAAIKQQAKTALAAIENATKLSSAELRAAQSIKDQSSPEMLESERAANAMLTAENAELKAINRQMLDALIEIESNGGMNDYNYEIVKAAISAAKGC